MTAENLMAQVRGLKAQLKVLEAQLKRLGADQTPKSFADFYGIWKDKVSSSEDDIQAALYRPKEHGPAQE